MDKKTKQCQNCKQDFVIEAEDFAYYDKINVPPPNWCPRCRLIRRLAWLKTFQLYRHVCNKCKKETLSMYPPDTPYNVYCRDCWWSDSWDPLEYGQDYDASRPFIEQFDELLHKTPIRGLAIDPIASKYSPYTNHVGYSKNCYLIFYSEDCEDSGYGFYMVKNLNTFDASDSWECENVYDVTNGWRSYNVFTAQSNVHDSVDCYFIKNVHNSNKCFGSMNLKNKQYVWFNEQLSKDEYEKRLRDFDSGSFKAYEAMRSKVHAHWRSQPPRPLHDYYMNTNVTGNYVGECKNCYECYDSAYCEDSKYIMLIKKGPVKDCYDYTDWGNSAQHIYECITVGENVSDVRFSQDVYNGHDIEYCKSCMNGSNMFGCVSLRGRDYCILNKQYTKEEYKTLRERIIENMKKEGSYGEFFPMTMSPHPYNESFAHLFDPKTKEQARAQGLKWQDIDTKQYAVTMQIEDIPDHINDASDDILQQTIQCPTCSRGYKVINQELQFLRKHKLPLPRSCPFCRIEDKVKRWVWQMTLVDRTCDNIIDSKRHGVTLRTHYKEEDAPTIYCQECYQKEIL